jgi:hypothetical protein
MKLLFLMMKITLTQIAIPKSSCGAAKELVSSKHFCSRSVLNPSILPSIYFPQLSHTMEKHNVEVNAAHRIFRWPQLMHELNLRVINNIIT